MKKVSYISFFCVLDVATALKNTSDGVGLLRTEHFLISKSDGTLSPEPDIFFPG